MIRKFKKDDLQACANIYKNVFTEDTWGCVWTQERAEEYLKDFIEYSKFVGFVSENNGVIDGAIFCCEKVSWTADELHVNELVVDPHKQGTGIGRQLIDRAKEYCREKGLAGIVLYTAVEAPAKSFYEKNDFKISDGIICMYWV